MRIKRLPLLCLSGVASAQATTQTLGDVLTAQSATLSTLNTWLASEQAVYSVLSNAQGVTLLAPSNNALNQLYSTSLATQLGQDANLLTAFLSYHVLSGIYSVSDLTTASPSSSIPTFLDIAAYSNVTGGQRVETRSQNGVVTFISGSGAQSNIESSVSHTAQTLPSSSSTSAPNHQPPQSKQNFAYVGGTLHIIDNVLTIPQTLSTSLLAAGLTAAVGALRRANVETALDTTADLTVFAPNNAAFNAIGSLVAGMTADQLSTVLGYHVVTGKVLYSELLAGGSQSGTAQGGNVSFRVEDGSVFVNSARVVQADLLVGNGVVHVVDGCVAPFFRFSVLL
jgi:uncharacterized surface protein with fasciclin (FAS1) repeats